MQFRRSHKIISSAVYNGGITSAYHILNLKVPLKTESNDSPQKTIREFSNKKKWGEKTVGMMTAASMDTLVILKKMINVTELVVIVTSGLSNARRVGDKADYKPTNGTINIIMYISGVLTEAAMVEAVMIITEAKTVVLEELQIVSPVSGKTATGTGTDSIVVVSGQGPETYEFCGKHILLGEIIGRTVINAVKKSIKIALSRIP
jgi:adenosylcobinamide amidohydrolase